MFKLGKICAVSTLLLTSSIANADMASWFDETEIAANVRIANDYLFYGASQTSGAAGNDNGTAIMGGFDITWTSLPVIGADLYSGIFAANTEWGRGTNDYASLEFTHYHGIAGEFGDSGVSWDFGGINYTYPNSDADAGAADDFDYWEIYGVLGYTFADVALEPSVSAGLYYSPAWFGYDDESYHIPVSLDLSLPYGLGLNMFFGHLEVDFSAGNPTTDDYQYYGIGISKTLLGVDLDVSYTAISDDDDCAIVQTGSAAGSQCGGIVFGMSKAF